jgi:hypothetical protein
LFFRPEHSSESRKKRRVLQRMRTSVWALERKQTLRRFSFQIWALGRKLNKRRVLPKLNVIADSWRFYEFIVPKPKIYEWSSWTESFMNEQKSKALWMSRNRRFVNDQAEPKILWISRVKIEDLWMISLNRSFMNKQKSKALWMSRNRRFVNDQAEPKWRFYEWTVPKPMIPCWGFQDRDHQRMILTEEILFREFQDRDRKKTWAFVWGFRDRGQRKTIWLEFLIVWDWWIDKNEYWQ